MTPKKNLDITDREKVRITIQKLNELGYAKKEISKIMKNSVRRSTVNKWCDRDNPERAPRKTPAKSRLTDEVKERIKLEFDKNPAGGVRTILQAVDDYFYPKDPNWKPISRRTVSRYLHTTDWGRAGCISRMPIAKNKKKNIIPGSDSIDQIRIDQIDEYDPSC